MNVTRTEICKIITHTLKEQGYEVSIVTAKRILGVYFEEVLNLLAQGRRIEIRGFGVYSVKERKARLGRNPRKDIFIPIPAHKAPHFKFSKDGLNLFNKMISQKS